MLELDSTERGQEPDQKRCERCPGLQCLFIFVFYVELEESATNLENNCTILSAAMKQLMRGCSRAGFNGLHEPTDLLHYANHWLIFLVHVYH